MSYASNRRKQEKQLARHLKALQEQEANDPEYAARIRAAREAAAALVRKDAKQ